MHQVLPTSLYEFKPEMFEAHVGETFYLEGPKGAILLRFVGMKVGKEPLYEGANRVPFTLYFIGPPGVYNDAHLMLNLRHRTLGLIEGVGIGPNVGLIDTEWGKGQLWSAIFN